MTIKKISVKQGGLKGLDVTYLKQDTTKDGRPTVTEVTEKRKHPVHVDLENYISLLKINLLEINRVDSDYVPDEDKRWLVSECEITALEFTEGYFCLSGTLRALDEKYIKLKTPKVQDSDKYKNFQAVMDTIKNIVSETKEYLNGTKKVSDEEITFRWIQAGKAEISMETFNGMTPDEQKEFCTKFLEDKYGSLVTHREDFEVVDEESNEFLLSEGNEPLEIPIKLHKSA